MKHCKDYTKINWAEIVRYDGSSPTGLTSIATGRPVGRKSSQRAVDENRIGWILSHSSSRWLVHRIIACLELGGIQQHEVVDHYDGNPYNNVIENLRVTTQSNNMKNRKMHGRNTSGINGVGVYKNSSGGEFVMAMWSVGGEQITKFFSIKQGKDIALQKAKEWRDGKETEDGNFTARHGL